MTCATHKSHQRLLTNHFKKYLRALAHVLHIFWVAGTMVNAAAAAAAEAEMYMFIY